MSFCLPLLPKANEIFISFLDIILQIYCDLWYQVSEGFFWPVIGSYIMRIYRIISEEYEIYPEKEVIHEVFWRFATACRKRTAKAWSYDRRAATFHRFPLVYHICQDVCFSFWLIQPFCGIRAWQIHDKATLGAVDTPFPYEACRTAHISLCLDSCDDSLLSTWSSAWRYASTAWIFVLISWGKHLLIFFVFCVIISINDWDISVDFGCG